MTQQKWSLGIDIGGTKILFAQILEKGDVLKQKTIGTQRSKGFEGIFKEIVDEIQRLLDESNSSPETIGIGIAGQVINNSYLKIAPNLNWRDISLQTIVQDYFNIPTHIINDVRAATWGEWKLGAGRGVSDLICIMIGTGIGGGIVTQDNLLSGFTGAAGELGHFPIELKGPLCSCGNRGCFEAIASGWALAFQAKTTLRENPALGRKLLSLVGDNIDNITAKEVLKAAEQGDELAHRIVIRAEEAIVAACIGYANVFNPACILIGGGLGWAMPNLCAQIQEGINRYCMDANREIVKVKSTAFKEYIVALGAASYAFDKQRSLK